MCFTKSLLFRVNVTVNSDAPTKYKYFAIFNGAGA